MQLFDKIATWQNTRAQLTTQRSLGFVPTMGNLHAGHLALIQRSKQENDVTLVSIFINYTQFNQAEDYQNYPKTLEADLALLKEAGVDFCILPTQADMYADHFTYQVHETTHSSRLEGQHRPGHFTGVLTVVMKLLNLANATRAYFGEKDFEQLHYIKGMVNAFFMPTQIIPCETVRETTGLALSSRNNRLTEMGKQQAGQFAALFHRANSVAEAKALLHDANMTIDYVDEWAGRRFAAVFIEGVRLIDNYAI